MKLLTTIATSNLFVSLLTSVLGAIFSIHLYKNKLHNSYLKETYETVIFPSFEMIEPYLYSQEIDDEVNAITMQICNLLQSNRMYISHKLWKIVYFCENDLKKHGKVTKAHFISLCSILSIEYDKCCKRLGLGPRSLEYKLSRHQFHPDKLTIIDYLFNFLSTVIYLIAAGFALILIMQLIDLIKAILKI